MKVFVFFPTFNDRVLIPALVKSVLALGIKFQTRVIDDGSDPPLETFGFLGNCEQYFKCPYNVEFGVATSIALDYAHQVKCEF